MKKLWFVFLFMLTGLFAFSQYSPIYVSGSVKDINGNPFAKQNIYFTSDSSAGWGYNDIAQTDSNGLYSIAIYPPAGYFRQFRASFGDCHNHRFDSFFTNHNQYIYLNYIQCFIPPPACIANFDFDSSFNITTYTRHFFDRSYGTPTSYSWNFGDGTISTLQNPTHTFAKGFFSVCLTIYDSVTNCSSTFCREVRVYNSSGVGFTHIDSNMTVHFSGNAYSSGTKSVSFEWDFGDGIKSTLQNPVHTYPSLSAFYVCLKADIVDSQNYTYNTSSCTTIFLGQSHTVPIYGLVYSNTYSIDKALIYLIKYNSTDSTLTAVDSIFGTDSSGSCRFTFKYVPNGNYLIKAALTNASTNYTNIIPTYFGDVLFWDHANNIQITNNSPEIIVNINMITGNNPGGPGFIGGKTSKGANIWELNPDLPIGNIEILLLDQAGNPVSYNFSKASGDFGFNSLALGTYQIYAELPGKKTTPAYVTIDAQHPSVNDVKIVITKKSIGTSVNPDISNSINSVGNIYPNPVQGNLNIDINLKKVCEVDFQIINSLGQVLNKNHFKLTSGRNTVSVDTHNLPQGIYVLNIKSSDGGNIFKNFTIIK